MISRDKWESSIIAQDDDKDYSESGWVAWVIDGVAYMGSYGHCSCFGTFDALCGGSISDYIEDGEPKSQWSGTVDELIDMARRGMDPNLAGRVADKNDCDYDHLMETYKQVLAWDARGCTKES